MTKLRLKSCYHPERVKPNMVILFSEKQNHHLKGKIYFHLLPFLKTGSYTADEIVDKLEKKAPAAEIYYALERLQKKGFLHEDSPACDKPMEAFFDLLGVDPQKALVKLNECKIFVKNLGKQNNKTLPSLLSANQVKFVDHFEEADLSIVITDHYLREELNEFSDLAGNRPWMIIKPAGAKIWIGPFFNKGKNGFCWKCLAKRMKTNFLEESFVQQNKKGFVPASNVGFKGTNTIGYQLAANEVIKWIVLDKHSPLESKLVTIDLLSLKIEDHLITFPPCSCNEKNKTALKPLVLQSFKKDDRYESGSRCFPPEYTLKKNSHVINPITGIVKQLEPVEEFNESCLHVYLAGHNLALSNSVQGFSTNKLRQSSSGKGKNDIQAKTSALCEAIERYCGKFHGNEPSLKSSYSQLKNLAIHPKELMLFSEKQYKNRKKFNQTCSPIHWIPHQFSESQEIGWTPVWSLTHQTYKYLPISYCYFGYEVLHDYSFCSGNSNGCSTGNIIEEALLHGFFELVERDCIAIWWYNRLQRPLVDLASFKDPFIAAFIEEYRKRGREVWVLDLTHDLHIPTFAAISRDLGQKERILFGFGTHFDANIALLRALTEMNQFFHAELQYETSNEEVILDQVVDYHIKKWLDESTIENQPYFQGLKDQPLTTSSTYPLIKTSDILEDIQRCQKIVEDLGMELLVLDQSRPDANLKVVKVVVPGLRHFWPRFAPGRLYDVPVKMGWLKKPLKESELNPIPVFF